MINVRDTAKDVGVSVEELIEILQDIEVAVEGPESELTEEQLVQVCDELGYASIEEARADNPVVEEAESVEEVVVDSGGEDAPAEEIPVAEEPSHFLERVVGVLAAQVHADLPR